MYQVNITFFSNMPDSHRLTLQGQDATKVYRFLPIFTATAKLCHPDLLPLTDNLWLASLGSRRNASICLKRFVLSWWMAVFGGFWRIMAGFGTSIFCAPCKTTFFIYASLTSIDCRYRRNAWQKFTDFYRYRKTLPSRPFIIETTIELNREPRQPREREGWERCPPYQKCFPQMTGKKFPSS